MIRAGSPPAGYRHADYARALAEFGTPRHLPASDGWILERPVPGVALTDAIGCYPRFACSDWAALPEDVVSLSEIVSLTVVTDPFGAYDPSLLGQAFQIVRPYKEHLVVDSEATQARRSRMHRRNIARGRSSVEVERCVRPEEHLDEWVELYGQLVRRHRISGMRAFSRDSFARQLRVPGVVVFRATADDQTVAMLVWYVDGDVAYAHLAAASERGYALRAPYAVYDVAIACLSESVRWLDLGAAPDAESADGLIAFKRAWATDSRTAFLCGRVVREAEFAALAAARGSSGSAFFPAYRAP